MKTLDLIQGSPEWLSARAQYFTASEAPAALGFSKYQTRSELLKAKATGLTPDVDAGKQRLFDAGHAAEAAARPIVESIIGDELFQATGAVEIEGLKLLASFDGITADDSVIWETKLWNESLAEFVRAGFLPDTHWPQIEHQLLVSGAEKCYFTISDGTPDRTIGLWYESVPKYRAMLIAGWKQFQIDLANYVPTEPTPKATATPQIGLPSVSIQVQGSIALIDNLGAFGAALTAYVERINKKPETDNDFATLEATVKTLKNAEEALDAAENGALAQTASIDSMRKTVALYRETARVNRLLVEKLVKSEKENRRNFILTEANVAYLEHIVKLNIRLGKPFMRVLVPAFAEVMRGLKSLDSMRDKVATELARCKIEANEAADQIDTNLKALAEVAKGYEYLFADAGNMVTKHPDDFLALVKTRIAEHQAREAQRLEAERARIAEQERIKAEAAVQAEIRQERAQIQAAAAKVIETTSVQQPTTVVTMPVRKTVSPTLRLGQIGERLGFNLTADFLKSIGFEPAARDKNAVLFHEHHFDPICDALVLHIRKVQEKQAA